MVLVHDAEQVFHHGRVRAVVIHPDFLRNDAALFLHALFRKIPGRDHAQQNLQIFFQMLRALDIVRRHGVARKGIVCPRILCKFLHRVSLGQVKHLVFEIVRHALRGRIFFAVQDKLRVNRTVVGRDERIALGKAGLFDHADQQPVCKALLKIMLSQLRKILSYHACTP